MMNGYRIFDGRTGKKCRFFDNHRRGGKTVLTELVEKRLGKGIPEMIPEIYAGGKRMIASFAPTVFEA